MAAGTYSDVVHNNNGTDSVYQLKLTLTPAVNDSTTEIICSDGYVYWRGKSYTKAGVSPSDSPLNGDPYGPVAPDSLCHGCQRL